jgi:prevent-host-death family protein
MEDKMLEVNIEKILPVTTARDSLNKIVDEIEESDELYVITKNGKPAAILVGVKHLEKLTGIDHKMILPDDSSGPNSNLEQNPSPAISSETASTGLSTNAQEIKPIETGQDKSIGIDNFSTTPTPPATAQPMQDVSSVGQTESTSKGNTSTSDDTTLSQTPQTSVSDENLNDLFETDAISTPASTNNVPAEEPVGAEELPLEKPAESTQIPTTNSPLNNPAPPTGSTPPQQTISQ